jgi:tetratricopeptide (TPR) repeat protein
VHVQLAEYPAARQRYEAALPIYRAIGDRLGEANCLLDLGRVTDDGGLMAQALAIHQEIGARFSDARDAFYYGDWLLAHGETAPAAAVYQLAADNFAAIGLANYAQMAQAKLAQMKGQE